MATVIPFRDLLLEPITGFQQFNPAGEAMILGAGKRPYLAVSAVLVTAYFFVTLGFDYLPHLHATMFWSPDATSYKAVGDWIFGIENTEASRLRPFFYPLLLNLTRAFGGVYGIWCFQLLLWCSSGLLLYRAIRTVTDNAALALAGVLGFAANLTLMLLTLHALTEVTTVFLLTLLAVLVVDKHKYDALSYAVSVLFLTSLLTVTKPLYIFLLLATFTYRLPVFVAILRRGTRRPRVLLLIVVALSPVFVQLSIMTIKHKTFAISEIGSLAIKRYFLAKVYSKVNHITPEEARDTVDSFERREVLVFLSSHYRLTSSTFVRGVAKNVLSESKFVGFPRARSGLAEFMKITNIIYGVIHILFSVCAATVGVRLFKEKRWDDLERMACLIFPVVLIVLGSGLSYGQGDRLVLPSLPLWLAAYSLVLSLLFQKRGVSGQATGARETQIAGETRLGR